jgi:Leucine-rich repeat (LRR) protein
VATYLVCLVSPRRFLLPSFTLSSLMRLPNISRNKLRALPDTLCSGLGSGQLQSLNVDHNELVALPEQIGALTSLTRLSVRVNYARAYSLMAVLPSP